MSAPQHVKTPLIASDSLSKAAGRQVLLKMDCVQPSGSFKIRGIGHFIDAHLDDASVFISSSGGNAGAAVAYAANSRGVPAQVVVPSTTPQFMRDRLTAAGATVAVHGDVWDKADAHARNLVETTSGAVYVSPFDHQLIWEGHATMIEEIFGQMKEEPSAVVVSVGGGGLLIGVCLGMEKVGWSHIPVIAAETKGADSFAEAQRAGRPVTIDGITSIAKSLGATQVSDECLVWEKRRNIISVTVTDQQAVEECGELAVENRVLVEPACGAALAAVRQLTGDLQLELHGSGPIVSIVCGGNMISPGLLRQYAKATGAALRDL